MECKQTFWSQNIAARGLKSAMNEMRGFEVTMHSHSKRACFLFGGGWPLGKGEYLYKYNSFATFILTLKR